VSAGELIPVSGGTRPTAGATGRAPSGVHRHTTVDSRVVGWLESLVRAVKHLWGDHMSLIAVGMVALQTVTRVVIVSRSYYWEDDFTHLSGSAAEPLSWGLMVSDYKDHLEILPNAVYWVLAHHASPSFAAPTAIIVAMQLAVSVLMWLLLRDLFGPQPFLLVPFAMFLFTPLNLANATWFAAGLEGLSLQLAMVGTLWCTARWCARPRWTWLLGALAFQGFGLLCWEKSLVILPAALLMQVLVVWRGRDATWIRRELTRGWRLWAGQLGLWVSYAALYSLVVDGSERRLSTQDGVSAATAVRDMVVGTFVPGLYGSPWNVSGAANTLYPRNGPVLQVVAVLVVVSLVWVSVHRLGRRAIRTWVFLGMYLAADVALLLWGRVGFFSITARDPRYVFDALIIACIVLAAGFLPLRNEDIPGERRPTQPGLSSAVQLAVLVGASCLLMSIQLAPVVERRESREFVAGMLAWLDRYPERSVVNAEMPRSVAFVRYRGVLQSVGRDAPFDLPGTQVFLFDGFAQMRPAAVPVDVLVRSAHTASCGWSVQPAATIGAIPSARAGPTNVVGLTYRAAANTTLRARVGSSPWQEVDVPKGNGQAWFVVPDQSGDIEVEAPMQADVCLAQVQAGPAWPG
jgi:hypothetical protein